ncbi:transposase [Paractinoplanes durhamensis]|uniref:transposase n=1 Tax=Paractinoplanes durhamensis TaxID=113563 RepID=UPI0034DB173A
MTRFASARSVVKHAGLNPAENTSATFRGQTRLSRRGRPGLRLAAWRAVWGALPHNPVLHAKFTHLTRRDTDRLPPHRPAPRAPRPCCAGCTPSSPAGSRSTPTSPPASTVPAGPSPRWPPDDLTSGGSDATADNSINLPPPGGASPTFRRATKLVTDQGPPAALRTSSVARCRDPATTRGTSPFDDLRRDAEPAAEPPPHRHQGTSPTSQAGN